MLLREAHSTWTVDVDDERLALFAQNGDIEAEEALIRLHWALVESRSRKYFIPGGEPEDLIQEGLFGLLKAIRDYRPHFGTSFRTFAELCITRQVITAVKSATRQKHSALNYYRSLNAPLYEELDSPSLAERIPDLDSTAVLRDELEHHREVIAQAREILSPYEFIVMQLYIAGLSYEEISIRVGKTIKSVDSAVFKVKLKLRRRFAC